MFLKNLGNYPKLSVILPNFTQTCANFAQKNLLGDAVASPATTALLSDYKYDWESRLLTTYTRYSAAF